MVKVKIKLKGARSITFEDNLKDVVKYLEHELNNDTTSFFVGDGFIINKNSIIGIFYEEVEEKKKKKKTKRKKKMPKEKMKSKKELVAMIDRDNHERVELFDKIDKLEKELERYKTENYNFRKQRLLNQLQKEKEERKAISEGEENE